MIQDGCKKFALCHLSQTNNSPELVMTTVYNVLLAAGIRTDDHKRCKTDSKYLQSILEWMRRID